MRAKLARRARSEKNTNVRDRVFELVNVLKYVSECMGIQYKFHAYLKHGLLLFCNPAPHSEGSIGTN